MSETNVAVDRRVGRPRRERCTDMMRSMLMRASHVTAPRSTIVTEHIGSACVQCEGRPTFRRTLDGTQPTVSFHWFIDCKRASKADVHRLILMATKGGEPPNVELSGRLRRPAGE